MVDQSSAAAELRATINETAGHRNAIDGRMVDIAIALLADESWRGDGLGAPEKFLAFRCGLSPTTAKRYLDVARRATELPESIDALRRGELSLDSLSLERIGTSLTASS